MRKHHPTPKRGVKIMPVTFKCSSKSEKIVIAATLATVLSVIFDEKKKKLRGSKKYRNFPKRIIKNYKLADSLLNRTIAKGLNLNEHFKDKQLDEMEIVNGEFIDI